MKNKNIKDIVFYTILIFVMVLSLNIAVKDLSGMYTTYLQVMLYSLLLTLCAMFVVYFPVTILIGLVAVGGYTGYLAIYHMGILNSYYIKISDFIYWLQGYIIGYESFQLRYSTEFAIIFALFTALIISILSLGKRGRFLLIILGTAAYAFFWYMYVNKAVYLLLMFLLASIMLYAYGIYYKRVGEWFKNESVPEDSKKSWLLSSSMIIGFCMIITFLLPFSTRPLRWEWLNDKVLNIFPFIQEWRNDVMESYSYGYDTRYVSGMQGSRGNTRLGGPVALNDDLMFNIETDSRTTMYLRGRIEDIYTGYSWSKIGKSYFQYKSNSELALPYDTNEVKTYDVSIKVTPAKLLTSTIFAPYKLYNVDSKYDKFYVDEDSEAFFSRISTKKDTYTVISVMPFLDEDNLRNTTVKLDDNMNYLQLPSSLPERVKELSHELTSQYDNYYDKIKAVESYLRSNFTYTLKPENVPSGRDFVDHFLFETKEGYCTYFATAMAVLLRASDIPCRYVEGFHVDYNGASVIGVKGKDAHAWVEVNFDKYGWINFEATPAYSSPKLVGLTNAGKASTSDDTVNDDITDIEQNDQQNGKEELQEEHTNNASTNTKFKLSFNFRNIPRLIEVLIIALILLRILYILIKKAANEILLKKSDGKKYVKRHLAFILRYFDEIGLIKKDEETLREFSNRISKDVEECSTDVDKVILIMERILYSGGSLKKEEKQIMENYRVNVFKQAYNRLGFIRFCWRELSFRH